MGCRATDAAKEKTAVGNDKAAQYGWAPINQAGTLQWIDKNEINIEQSYQREASTPRILRIAREWSWIACGTITVARRADKFYAIDGQHRVLAAKRHSGIKKLPCVVFNTKSTVEEATGYVESNTMRHAMSSIDKFRAQVAGRDDTALFVSRTLAKLGLVVGNDESGKTIRCIGTLYRMAEINRDNFNQVLIFCSELCQDGFQISERLVRGIDYINQHCGSGLNDARLRERLIDSGPGSLLDGAARAIAFYGKSGEKIFACGFLETINKGLRNKFSLDGEEA